MYRALGIEPSDLFRHGKVDLRDWTKRNLDIGILLEGEHYFRNLFDVKIYWKEHMEIDEEVEEEIIVVEQPKPKKDEVMKPSPKASLAFPSLWQSLEVKGWWKIDTGDTDDEVYKALDVFSILYVNAISKGVWNLLSYKAGILECGLHYFHR